MATLGHEPDTATVVLSKGAQFILTFRRKAGPWTLGTSCRIEWANGVTWNAQVAGDLMSWKIAATGTTAAVIPPGTDCRIFLQYPGDTDPYLWFRGKCKRAD
ncbi:hypothetical protein RCF19_29830 [Rhodococcus qingshengii]